MSEIQNAGDDRSELMQWQVFFYQKLR